jgi:hypothetical protein
MNLLYGFIKPFSIFKGVKKYKNCRFMQKMSIFVEHVGECGEYGTFENLAKFSPEKKVLKIIKRYILELRSENSF